MKENNSITAEELIKDLQEVFDGNGVPNLNYVKAKLNEYKANTVTLEQLEEEKRKAVLEALERVREKLTKKTYTDSFVSLNAFEVIDEEIKKQK